MKDSETPVQPRKEKISSVDGKFRLDVTDGNVFSVSIEMLSQMIQASARLFHATSVKTSASSSKSCWRECLTGRSTMSASVSFPTMRIVSITDMSN